MTEKQFRVTKLAPIWRCNSCGNEKEIDDWANFPKIGTVDEKVCYPCGTAETMKKHTVVGYALDGVGEVKNWTGMIVGGPSEMDIDAISVLREEFFNQNRPYPAYLMKVVLDIISPGWEKKHPIYKHMEKEG